MRRMSQNRTMTLCRPPRLAITGIACLALAACAGDKALYPELAHHDAERATGIAPTVAPDTPQPPVATPPADLPARLAAIGMAADKAHATFLEREAVARAKIGPEAQSEPETRAWSDAEVALSSLESARSDTMFALADLDSLLATGSVAEADSGIPAGLPEITSARERVAALIAREDAVLAELRGR